MEGSAETKAAEAPKDATERPMDRPMTGILTRDDGKRTEHGLHPLDPSYNGTTFAVNKGVEEAAAARAEAGLEDPSATPASDADAGKESA